MAALISMEVAKSHLRVTSDDHNADIQLKVVQASAIILDYLKGRANKPATITSSSVASPTVITTEDAHGYITGETATIVDHEDSTPAIDGAHVVTVLTTTTFSIPVAVTVAGTGGTAIVLWDEDTTPGPVQSAVLLFVSHLFEHRGDDQKTDADLWLAIERLLIRSRDPAFA